MTAFCLPGPARGASFLESPALLLRPPAASRPSLIRSRISGRKSEPAFQRSCQFNGGAKDERLTSRGRQWDLSGPQVIHPVSLLRSWTPVEPTCPCLGGHIGAAPTSGTVKASYDKHFGAHSRSCRVGEDVLEEWRPPPGLGSLSAGSP